MNHPVLYIFVGYPGAGKTSVSKLIAARTGAVHIWADHERQALFANPTHSFEESKQLYEILDEQTEELLAAGKSVIFDTNFNYHADRELLRQIADKHQATMVIIWLTTPRAIAKERALHHTHRDRNGYMATMTEAEFDRLTNHLEAPTEDEHPVKIDGSKIVPAKLYAALDI